MTTQTETAEEFRDAIIDLFHSIADGNGQNVTIEAPDGSSVDYEGILAFLGSFTLADYTGGAEEAATDYLKAYYPEYL